MVKWEYSPTNQSIKLVLIIIPLVLILLTPSTLVFGHQDYTQSKGCEIENMTALRY